MQLTFVTYRSAHFVAVPHFYSFFLATPAENSNIDCGMFVSVGCLNGFLLGSPQVVFSRLYEL